MFSGLCDLQPRAPPHRCGLLCVWVFGLFKLEGFEVDGFMWILAGVVVYALGDIALELRNIRKLMQAARAG
jgi:hypothetical protein